MGFINVREHLDFIHRENLRTTAMLSISDFKDKSDRTLTISSEFSQESSDDREFTHVFIMGGLLQVHKYLVKEDGETVTRSTTSGSLLSIGACNYRSRRVAAYTDYEFARMMEELHAPLTFYSLSYENKENKIEEVAPKFFGLTTPILVPDRPDSFSDF